VPYSVSQLLEWVPLTEAVETVKTGIPKVLPPEFWTLTEDVSGYKARLVEYQGTRRVARVTPYGSPPRQVEHLPLGDRPVILLHTNEEIAFRDELVRILREWDEYKPQQKFAVQEIARQGEGFRQRFENLEIAAVTKTVADGRLYFDADGNLLPTSSGADLTVDQLIPSGNRLTVSNSWATAATDIVTYINTLKNTAVQTTGYPLKYAIYGQNIPGYFNNNTSIQNYWWRNQQFSNDWLNTGRVPERMLELIWVPAQQAFWEDQTGTVQSIFPADQVTFTPEITAATWTFYRGSKLVPTQTGPFPDAEAAIRSTQEVFGRGRYAKIPLEEPTKIIDVGFDTFLPRIKQPSAWFFVDTTP
jgi:hypothetical protein